MIKLESVDKIFPDGTQAVKNLSLEIDEGEFCVFLGPSGCGKTTSLKMINKLIPHTGGKIYVNGVDTETVNQNHLRRDIGYAIQNIGLFPHLTVSQNIATVPVLKKWPQAKQRERARELLELVGMDPDIFLDRYPSELSGGQQQRVGVARSLGGDPPILLMDEPFGAIDPITRSRLQDEFLKIQAKIKKTIVFVTHDINEAIKMGDTIALMKGGELIQYDTPANLLYAPKNEFVRNFVGGDRVLKSLRLHKTSEVMKDPPLAIKTGDDPTKTRNLMKEKALTWAMLTDEQDRFLGWIRARDIESTRPLREIMEKPTVIAEPETRLNEALSMMLNSAIGNLAVVDEKNVLLGVVSFETIRDVLAEQEDAEQEDAGDEQQEGGGEE